MRMFALLKGGVLIVVSLAAGSPAAATLVGTFPELQNPLSFEVVLPFPHPAVTVGSVLYSIPLGERVVAAKISGFWGTNQNPAATAGVDVLVDGVLVARCVKNEAGCWEPAADQRPWSHIFAESELKVLNDGVATLTAMQTSEFTVQLGVSTLIIETGPPPAVPTLSPLGLLFLLAGVATMGALAIRRFQRAQS